MSRTDPNIKELNDIKIITEKPANFKGFKYFTISSESDVLPLKQTDTSYMFHHFELDGKYGWCTIKVTKV